MALDYDAPYVGIGENEVKGIIFNFATLCSLLENRHLSFQLVMSFILSNKNYRNLLKHMLNEKDDLNLFRTIISVVPEVATSKYVSRMAKSYLQS